jgi:hypothetical protein
MSATKRTRNANRELVEELFPLDPSVQQARILALTPKTRIDQVGKQLAKALLNGFAYSAKTPEEQASYKASLPPFHQRYIQIVLKEGIKSATRKKSHSSKGAAATRKNSANMNEEVELSEFDKRLEEFKREGVPVSYLYDISQDPEDAKTILGFENMNIPHDMVPSPENERIIKDLVRVIMFLEETDPSHEEERNPLVQVIRLLFKTSLDLRKKDNNNKINDANWTLKDYITQIKENMDEVVPIPIDSLDDSIPLHKYCSSEELQMLAVLYTQSMYSSEAYKHTLIEILLPFITMLKTRVEARRLHGKTRKSQYGLKSTSASPTVNAAEKAYALKQMNILTNGPGKPALTYNQKQSALRALAQQRKTYFDPIPFTDPISDEKGFRQHVGECSSDVVLQLFIFGAPWFASVQETLYNMTVARFNTLFETMIGCPGHHVERASFLQLIQNMQARFKIHYTSVKLKREADACVQPFDYRKIAPILERKDRKSGELGPKVLNNIKTLTNTLYSTHPPYVKHILQLLFNFFGMNFLCYLRITDWVYKNSSDYMLNFDIKYTNYSHLGFIFRQDPFSPAQVTLESPTTSGVGHYTAIYKSMENVWTYYDNNLGTMQIHKTLMTDILNELGKFLIGFIYKRREGVLRSIFYKIPYFNSNYLDELNRKTIFKWNEDKWDEVLFSDISPTATIYTFIRTIHIVSKSIEDPGFKANYVDDV